MYLFRDAEDDGEEAASDEDRPRHLDLVGGEVEPNGRAETDASSLG
jgi:hypothetical protein